MFTAHKLYQCHFKTQGPTEDAASFAVAIENFFNALMSRKNVLEVLSVQITSDSNGRKEAFFQWYKTKSQEHD